MRPAEMPQPFQQTYRLRSNRMTDDDPWAARQKGANARGLVANLWVLGRRVPRHRRPLAGRSTTRGVSSSTGFMGAHRVYVPRHDWSHPHTATTYCLLLVAYCYSNFPASLSQADRMSLLSTGWRPPFLRTSRSSRCGWPPVPG